MLGQTRVSCPWWNLGRDTMAFDTLPVRGRPPPARYPPARRAAAPDKGAAGAAGGSDVFALHRRAEAVKLRAVHQRSNHGKDRMARKQYTKPTLTRLGFLRHSVRLTAPVAEASASVVTTR